MIFISRIIFAQKWSLILTNFPGRLELKLYLFRLLSRMHINCTLQREGSSELFRLVEISAPTLVHSHVVRDDSANTIRWSQRQLRLLYQLRGMLSWVYCLSLAWALHKEPLLLSARDHQFILDRIIPCRAPGLRCHELRVRVRAEKSLVKGNWIIS